MNLMLEIIVNVIIAFLMGSLLTGFHRKIMARIQQRPGPPIVQHILHSLKFFFKETTYPKTAAMPFYVSITVILCAIWITGIIIGPVSQGSLFVLFAIYAIHKIVEHNSGSSSGSPYGKLSCVRAVFSAASELPLFAVLAFVYLQTGSMIISDIVAYQTANGPLFYSLPLVALVFFVLLIAKSPYSPFSITKGKDIISGFETEHFGLLRGFIMFSESIAWYVLLWIFLTVFFSPLPLIAYVLGMIIITGIIAVINALTPILNPNHSVMNQITIAIIGFTGTIILMLVF
ncbi:MAG: respiratory chain complex I subunit 1 family protein [Methanobacteriaceae archaeon]